jgi:hypothetical protein
MSSKIALMKLLRSSCLDQIVDYLRMCDDDLQLNGYDEEFALGAQGIKELIKDKINKALVMVNDEDDVECLLAYVTEFKVSRDLGGFAFKCSNDDVVVHNFYPADDAMASSFLMKAPLKFVDLKMDCDMEEGMYVSLC